MSTSVLDRLETLHATYVEAINDAVATDRPEGVRRLSAAYDVAAARLLAESLELPVASDSPRRGRAALSRLRRAA